MKANEIENVVRYFHEQEMQKVHARVNSTVFWRQSERMAQEMATLDQREAAFRESLGPADEPDEPQEPAEPVAVVVTPGVKA